MALEGTLKDFSLADIFQLIGLQRKTGVLTLRSPEDVVTISFLDGKVVGADSLNKRLEDRLGQVLLKTWSSARPSSTRRCAPRWRRSSASVTSCIRHSMISRDELRRALEKQILQIIFRVFRWQDGDYHFSQETSVDYDAELVTPMSAESILMEGARMLDEWPIIEKRIPHRGIVFVPTQAARTVEVAPRRTSSRRSSWTSTSMRGRSSLRLAGACASPRSRRHPGLADGVNDRRRHRPREPPRRVRNLQGDLHPADALSCCARRPGTRSPALRRRSSRPCHPRPTAHLAFPGSLLALVPVLVFSRPHRDAQPPQPAPRPVYKLPPPHRHGHLVGADVRAVADSFRAGPSSSGTFPETLAELVHERYVDQSLLSGSMAAPLSLCHARPVGDACRKQRRMAPPIPI